MGDAEDEMKVADGQQFLLPFLKPLVARSGLTLGTVPVAACNGVHSITCLMGSFLLWGVRRTS